MKKKYIEQGKIRVFRMLLDVASLFSLIAYGYFNVHEPTPFESEATQQWVDAFSSMSWGWLMLPCISIGCLILEYPHKRMMMKPIVLRITENGVSGTNVLGRECSVASTFSNRGSVIADEKQLFACVSAVFDELLPFSILGMCLRPYVVVYAYGLTPVEQDAAWAAIVEAGGVKVVFASENEAPDRVVEQNPLGNLI